MAQQGQYEIRGGWWVVRFREPVMESGEVRKLFRTRQVVKITEIEPRRDTVQELRANGSGPLHVSIDRVPEAVKVEARKYLDSANASNGQRLESARKLQDFYYNIYLPQLERDEKAASTIRSYKNLWAAYIDVVSVRLGQGDERLADLWMKDITTAVIYQTLNNIADANRKGDERLSGNTLKHIKSFLSGVFSLAVNLNFIENNPVKGAKLPKGEEAEDTYAYNLDEIDAILRVLPSRAATMLAVAAYAGLRRGELVGMRWEHYDGHALRVEHSVVEGSVGKPKTKASRSAVPVIPQLAKRLDLWWEQCDKPAQGWVFESERGTPLSPNNVLNREIAPALEAANKLRKEKDKLVWHGYHSFRRGLASNLKRLGVNDLTIARILRHSDVSVTRQHYIQMGTDDLKRELNRLQRELSRREAGEGKKKPAARAVAAAN